MANKQSHELVPMDGHTAQEVSTKISSQIDCRENLEMPFSNTAVAAWLFGGLLNSYGVICRELARTEISDDPKYHQCVVMSGDVHRCPKFGVVSGQAKGEHERLAQVAALQRYIEEHINLREDINLYSLTDE